MRIFQYKILYNISDLNKKLFEFTKINSPECFFANVKKRQLFICFIFVDKREIYGRN